MAVFPPRVAPGAPLFRKHLVSLSLREKQLFYDQLGQLLRAGLPVGQALAKLVSTSRGQVAVFLRSLQGELSGGATLGEAFAQARPALSQMEQATLAGLARSGQMESGLRQLALYFGALDSARREVKARLLYPLFLLHFGVLTLNAPLLFMAELTDYLKATGYVFGALYLVLIAAVIFVPMVREAGASAPALDRLLRLLPFLGKIRRAFAASRFCATYNMQLDAGVNVLDSLQSAARASRSGLIEEAVQRALPEVRRGEQAGEQLAKSPGAFPKEMLSAIVVAEQTGRLDQTLNQLAEEYQAEAFRAIKVAAEWIPRLIYVTILLFLGWKIVRSYQGQMRQLDSVFEGL